MNITDPHMFSTHVRHALRHGSVFVIRLARDDAKAMLCVMSPAPVGPRRTCFYLLATARAGWVYAVFHHRASLVRGHGCDSNGFILAPPEVDVISELLARVDRAPQLLRGDEDDFANLRAPAPAAPEPILARIAAMLDADDLSGADLHQELVTLLTTTGHYPPATDVDDRDVFVDTDGARALP